MWKMQISFFAGSAGARPNLGKNGLVSSMRLLQTCDRTIIAVLLYRLDHPICTLLEMGPTAAMVAIFDDGDGAPSLVLRRCTSTRAKVEVVCDDADDISLSKRELEWALAVVEMEVDAMQAEQDEAIGKAIITKERALKLSDELAVLGTRVMTPCAYNTDLDAGVGLPLGKESLASLEQIAGPSSKELELPTEFELMRVKVAWLRT
ncbi:hypothetical protein ACLOJK_035179 [Asimina triloba]